MNAPQRTNHTLSRGAWFLVYQAVQQPGYLNDSWQDLAKAGELVENLNGLIGAMPKETNWLTKKHKDSDELDAVIREYETGEIDHELTAGEVDIIRKALKAMTKQLRPSIHVAQLVRVFDLS